MGKNNLILIVICLFFIACSNVNDLKSTKEATVKGLKFNGNNQEEVLQKVVESNELTDKEIEYLKSAIQGYSITDYLESTKFLNTPPIKSIVGKTVEQLIEEGKEKEIKNKKHKKEYKKMLKHLVVSLDKISIEEYKSPLGGTNGWADLDFIFKNKSDKDIKAFKGAVWVDDLFGDNIEIIPLKYDEGLKVGEKKNVIGKALLHYKEFKNKKVEDLKLKWTPTAIIFEDGSSLGLESD